MFWADKVAAEIIASGKYKPFWVDDMFTPSGYPHVGSLRGPLVHDIVYKALRDKRVDAKWTYVMNDFDPIDGLPPELEERFKQYYGLPVRSAPSPEEGYGSFGEYFAKDIQKVLKELGVEAEYLSSWDMYHEGKFNEVIRIALDNSEKIQDIYEKVSGSKKREKGWLPLQVICENCGKLGTTRVHDWDGKTVAYVCEPDMVRWAKGCGTSARISPFDGNGKLPWKVDWPAHWKVLGVTIEGAGKDHASAGGSYDIAMEICEEVFNCTQPYKLPYEFILIGGRKMSSSRGIGLKAHDMVKILPANLGRFLLVGRDIKSQANFDPDGTQAIPDLFDEYDRAWTAYNTNGDESLSQAFVYAQIDEIPDKNPKMFLPRFRDVANYLQLPNVDLRKQFELIKGSPYTENELKVLAEREKYAKIWLEKYAPQDFQTQMVEELPAAAKGLNEKQKEYLTRVIELLAQSDDPDDLQTKLYDLSKTVEVPAKEAFTAIYLAMIGKTHGPKAAWFLLQYPKEQGLKRLKEASSLK